MFLASVTLDDVVRRRVLGRAGALHARGHAVIDAVIDTLPAAPDPPRPAG